VVTNKVNYFDPKTGKVVAIPVHETTDGMVLCKVEGHTEPVWVERETAEAAGLLQGGRFEMVDACNVRPSPIQHSTFGPEVRPLLEKIHSTLPWMYGDDADPIGRWEEGFRRDIHPGREVALWLYMVEVLEHFTQGRELNDEQKQHIFQVVSAVVNSGGEREAVMKTLPRTLSKKRADAIEAYMKDNANRWREIVASLPEPLCRLV
jgi:hypothetical protein